MVHQSKKWDRDADSTIYRVDPDAWKWILDNCDERGIGAIIGKTVFGKQTDYIKSKWFFGDFAWPCSNGVLFATPIPYKGQLNFFEVKL